MYLHKTRRERCNLFGSHTAAQSQRQLVIQHDLPLFAFGTITEKSYLGRAQRTHIISWSKNDESLSGMHGISYRKRYPLPGGFNLLGKACQNLFQIPFIERFQQIIECRFPNSLYHIFVVRRIKYDPHIPRYIIAYLLQQFQPRHVRHLYIQKQQIGLHFHNKLLPFPTIPCSTFQREAGIFPQLKAQIFKSYVIIIYYNDFVFVHIPCFGLANINIFSFPYKTANRHLRTILPQPTLSIKKMPLSGYS